MVPMGKSGLMAHCEDRLPHRHLNDKHAVIPCTEFLPMGDGLDERSSEKVGGVMRTVAFSQLLRNEVIAHDPRTFADQPFLRVTLDKSSDHDIRTVLAG
jgi:hypothetical protein